MEAIQSCPCPTATPLPATPAQRLQLIYAKDYRRLCTAARMVLGEEHLAQDAVQEAWLRLSRPNVLSGLATGDEDKLRNLVLVTVRNTAHNLRRGQTKIETPGEDAFAEVVDNTPAPEQQAETRDAARRLKMAMQKLDETDRSILMLQYDNGCTGKQIAALLGMREAAVRKRAQRAKQQLKKILQKEGI